MKTNKNHQTLSRMKRLEEMSREELIEEIISNSRHLEEIEEARKDEERVTAELEKQVRLLKNIEKSLSHGKSRMAEAIPKLQELLKMENENIAKLQKKIDAMEQGNSL